MDRFGATVGLLLIAVACRAGGDDADADVEPVAVSTTTTTQAPGTEPDDVESHVENLLASYDEAVTALNADPAAAADPAKPLAEEYRKVFEPGSAEAERALQSWAANVASGERYLPYEDGGLVNESKLDGELVSQSADEVTFPVCNIQSFRHYDGTGALLDEAERRLIPGEGRAVRVGGRWYLHDLTSADNLIGCVTEEMSP